MVFRWWLSVVNVVVMGLDGVVYVRLLGSVCGLSWWVEWFG